MSESRDRSPRRAGLDDLLVGVALAAAATLCLLFRYLPMVDLPQHTAMVSILAHHGDPSLGFDTRFTIDLLARPYASVYVTGAGLAQLLPLQVAMRIVVALCTVAPLAGVFVLLRAMDRPRLYALLAVPFLFGASWHWGFLNFLLGTGLLLLALAQVIATTRRPTAARLALTGGLGLALLFTHVHGLAMLVILAPLYAWAWGEGQTAGWRAWRAVWPLAPAAIGGGLFLLFTWGRVEGSWEVWSPGPGERLDLLVPFLAGGVAEPWPWVAVAALAAAAALAFLVRDRGPSPTTRRQHRVAGAALALQLVFYFGLPVNMKSVAFVAPRHALLAVFFLLPLLPSARPRWQPLLRGLVLAIFAGALIVVGSHLVRFDREARAFDAILEPMAKNRRVAALIFDRSGQVVHPSTFPYVHFAAYYQAHRGGDILDSFASIWNMPVQYRKNPLRHRADPRIVWAPQLFSFERDLPHYDYLVLRGAPPEIPPPEADLELAASSGAFRLYANPHAVRRPMEAR